MKGKTKTPCMRRRHLPGGAMRAGARQETVSTNHKRESKYIKTELNKQTVYGG